MGLDYSYTQPSESEDLFCNDWDSGDSETDALIQRDQAEISLQRRSPVHYPPQPEVEFGFPQRCYCGAQPVLATSDSRWNDIGRRYSHFSFSLQTLVSTVTSHIFLRMFTQVEDTTLV